MFQNMTRPQGAETEVDHNNQGEESGCQGRLREGPLRKLRKAELQLLEDLGLHEEKPLSLAKVVWGVEVLLLASVAMQILTMHLAGQLEHFSPLDALNALFTGQTLGHGKLEDEREDSLRNLHVMASIVGHVFFVPQLLMLVLVAEEKTSMVLQFIFMVIISLVTATTHVLSHTIKAKREETCNERRSCTHNIWGWYFFINNIWFSVTVLLRLLFNLRWRMWCTNLRVVGPLIAFLTSRKCREFQALCLMACLGATTLSGLVLYWPGFSGDGGDGKIPSTGTIVAASSTGVLTFAALTLLLASYLVPHFSFNHRTVVSEAELKAALERLGEDHREELSKRWWDGR